jgi:hypothetical protein
MQPEKDCKNEQAAHWVFVHVDKREEQIGKDWIALWLADERDQGISGRG